MHPTQATTECKQQSFEFQGLGGGSVEGDFAGGHVAGDGGGRAWRAGEGWQRGLRWERGGDHATNDTYDGRRSEEILGLFPVFGEVQMDTCRKRQARNLPLLTHKSRQRPEVGGAVHVTVGYHPT